MNEQDWKAELRVDLERWGERAVRDDMNHRGALATGGEERRQFVLKWLRQKDLEREEKDLARDEKEKSLVLLAEKTFNYTRRTYYAALAALGATIIGIAITLLHR